MPRQLIDLGPRPLLDIASYARRGPGRRDHLSPAEIELIARTAHRPPEVMVKVLTRGGQDLGAVGRHLEYLDRKGELEIETDDGRKLSGKGGERVLLEDWDLDIEEDRRGANLEARPGRSLPKLVHKVLFSMPPGTPPTKVLEAAKSFAREEFGLKHRYAMVLHTDEPHPHVHLVLKAVSEQGVRLNIKKAALRHWRAQFARHLRGLGVAANATERAVRGEGRSAMKDGVYRARKRGESKYLRTQVDAVAKAMFGSGGQSDPSKSTMLETQDAVRQGWQSAANKPLSHGDRKLAAEVVAFVGELVPPLPAREQLKRNLREIARASPRRSRVR